MRLRLTFAKTKAMQYTGHLDLHRTLERTLVRAKLPVSYSQGFNPRVKMNLAAALPLGFTGEAELAEVWLNEDLPVETVMQAILSAAPPGIALEKVSLVQEPAPKMQNIVAATRYIVTLLDLVTDLTGRVQKLLSAESISRQRRKKTYDLRPLILSLMVIDPDESGKQRLEMHLMAKPGQNGRPDEVVEALGVDKLSARYHRTHVELDS